MTLLPTVPGTVQGIVALDPPTVQCHDCHATYTAERISLAVILSGYTFHTCNAEAEKVRRCRDCKAKSVRTFRCLCARD